MNRRSCLTMVLAFVFAGGFSGAFAFAAQAPGSSADPGCRGKCQDVKASAAKPAPGPACDAKCQGPKACAAKAKAEPACDAKCQDAKACAAKPKTEPACCGKCQDPKACAAKAKAETACCAKCQACCAKCQDEKASATKPTDGKTKAEPGCCANCQACCAKCQAEKSAEVTAAKPVEKTAAKPAEKPAATKPAAVFRMGPPPGRGPNRGNSNFAADRDVFHYLLDNHKDIRRTVKNLNNGVSTLTESDTPEVAKKIQSHVPAMYERLKTGAGFRYWDPVFVEVFKHADKMKMTIEKTDKGVKVTETSEDAAVVKLIQYHAQVVNKFVEHGFDEAHKEHPVPKTEKKE